MCSYPSCITMSTTLVLTLRVRHVASGNKSTSDLEPSLLLLWKTTYLAFLDQSYPPRSDHLSDWVSKYPDMMYTSRENPEPPQRGWEGYYSERCEEIIVWGPPWGLKFDSESSVWRWKFFPCCEIRLPFCYITGGSKAWFICHPFLPCWIQFN